jgi:hypothetical protein
MPYLYFIPIKKVLLKLLDKIILLKLTLKLKAD